MIGIKPGIKRELFNYSRTHAESLEVVRERVFKILKGKHLVGYQLMMKLADFGLFEMSEEEIKAIVSKQDSNQSEDIDSGDIN